MAANLIFAPEAETDLSEAYDWYEQQRAGLGDQFLDAVNACMSAVCASPRMHRVVFKTYRRALVRRFPYGIYYEYDDTSDTVTAYVVIHTARNPQTWKDRLN
jgi:plasmid stabilization system protein ParE